MRRWIADGTDGADAFSGLVAYARAWGVKPKMASVASAASAPKGAVLSDGVFMNRLGGPMTR